MRQVDEAVSDQTTEEQHMPASEIERVKLENEQRLLSINGVVGIGIGRSEIGDEVIVVYLREKAAKAQIPSELGGFSIRTEFTGEIDAYGDSA